MPRRLSALKDSHIERRLFRGRVFAVWIGITFLIFLLLIRLAYLQIYEHKVYTTLAKQNLLNLLPAEPNRGLIYDRNGVLLADNHPFFNLVVTPNRVPDLKSTLVDLQKIVPISGEDIQQFNRQLTLQRRFAPLVLHTKLSEEEVARFSVEQYHFPGVTIQAQMIRSYPLGAAFAQVIGYVGRINAKELAEVDPSNYSATNFIGKIGVEKSYETALHGNVGYQQAETDATGKIIRVMNDIPPIPGNNLYLTIDSRLQMAAEQILGEQRGAIVAINPQNGEVLALVSNPSYDPNLFVTGISKKDYQQLSNAPNQPLYNRALHGRYPPGSTIKPFFAIGGLASNTITPDYTIFDPGYFQLKNSEHLFRDMLRTGHGSVDLARAIQVSCDTYFYNLADKLGINYMDEILNQFGFGKPTGIDLSDEVSGLVPSPEWKKRVQHKPWYAGDTLITGIGQGFMLVTPLQLATAVSIIAMHGQHFQPHLLLKEYTPQGKVNLAKSTLQPPVVLDDKNWDLVIDAMQNVAKAPGGTAYRFFNNAPYTLAGKTGTAQVFSLKKNQQDKAALLPENLRDNSLFIAFAPVDHPQIAIAVMLQHSITPAASVARQVLDAYFKKDENLGLVKPNKPKEEE